VKQVPNAHLAKRTTLVAEQPDGQKEIAMLEKRQCGRLADVRDQPAADTAAPTRLPCDISAPRAVFVCRNHS